MTEAAGMQSDIIWFESWLTITAILLHGLFVYVALCLTCLIMAIETATCAIWTMDWTTVVEIWPEMLVLERSPHSLVTDTQKLVEMFQKVEKHLKSKSNIRSSCTENTSNWCHTGLLSTAIKKIPWNIKWTQEFKVHWQSLQSNLS